MTKMIVLTVINVIMAAIVVGIEVDAIRRLRASERNAERTERAADRTERVAADVYRRTDEALRNLAFEHLDLAEAWRLLGDVDLAQAHEEKARSLATPIGDQPDNREGEQP